MVSSQYLFSYWIFIWCILYGIGILSFNPYYILVGANIFILITLIYVLLLFKNSKQHYVNILIFFCINFVMKFLPMIYFSNFEKSINDVVFGLILFLIYLIFINYSGYNLFDIYNYNEKPVSRIRNGELPIMVFVKNTFNI